MKRHRVLVVGDGGREHIIGRMIGLSPEVEQVFFAPGNGGTGRCGTNIGISATEFRNLVNFAEKNEISFTVVGPDEPLSLGIVDCFMGNNLSIFGPISAAAKIESSKIFAKNLMVKKGILTAPFTVCLSARDAMVIAENHPLPFVVKADGLASGKGVSVCFERSEARKSIEELMIERRFGASGDRVIIEDFVPGEELSYTALVDKHRIVAMPPARDHKKLLDGDKGPNTGGMGCFAPVPDISASLLKRIRDTIAIPILEGLAELGIVYRGCLYLGLKITPWGDIYTLEANARFGDPEAQAILTLMEADLFHVFESCVYDKLNEVHIEWRNDYAVSVAICSGGYPSWSSPVARISRLEELESTPGIDVYHSGTKYIDGQYWAIGGKRVIHVVSCGTTVEKASANVYNAIARSSFQFDDMNYRRDIGIQS